MMLSSATALPLLQLTGKTNSPFRMMTQVLLSPCRFFSRLRLHLPACSYS